MNLDELQSVRNRERQTDSLQQLSDTFYRDAGEFIRELKRERARVAEAADDPFDSTDVRRLTDEIKTAESTVESIYERRVGKVVKQASLEAAGMPADADGLTAEELDLFETMVSAIENSREHVLNGLLAGGAGLDCTGTGSATDTGDGEAVGSTDPPATGPTAGDGEPGADPTAPPGSEPARSRPEQGDPDGVSAAEAMGAEGSRRASDAAGEATPPSGPAGDGPTPVEPDREPASEPDPEPAASYPEPGTGGDPGDDGGDVERATVRITDDVGEIYGVDDRAYELSAEDVVTLPSVNANPLVERGAAERLD
jgi:DNA replication factor GINS